MSMQLFVGPSMLVLPKAHESTSEIIVLGCPESPNPTTEAACELLALEVLAASSIQLKVAGRKRGSPDSPKLFRVPQSQKT